MEYEEINGTNELEELRREYIATKENFSNEKITDADSVEKSIRLGLKELKLAKRRWLLLSIGGIAAFAAALPFVYGMIKSTALLVSTGIIILLYGLNAFLSNASRLDSLYGKDNDAFIKSVRKHQTLQYWFIRIFIVAFCFWAGFMITLPFVKFDSNAEKLAFLAVLLPFLIVILFATIRMHNIVIGAYDGLLFDNTDVSEHLAQTYYSEEAIRDRRHRTAKRKYITCIMMIFVMSAFFVWQFVRVLNGNGIASLLPVYLIFVVVFALLARENKKDWRR